MTPALFRVVSHARAGRLTPPRAKGLRAGAVRLAPGEIMEWHSTREREELIVVIAGRVALELQSIEGRRRIAPLAAGQSAFLPSHTLHRMVNRSRTAVHYIYITASAT